MSRLTLGGQPTSKGELGGVNGLSVFCLWEETGPYRGISSTAELLKALPRMVGAAATAPTRGGDSVGCREKAECLRRHGGTVSLEVWVPGCCPRGSWHPPITPALLQVPGVCHAPGLLPEWSADPFLCDRHAQGGVPKDGEPGKRDRPWRARSVPPCPSALPQNSPNALGRHQQGGKGQPG